MMKMYAFLLICFLFIVNPPTAGLVATGQPAETILNEYLIKIWSPNQPIVIVNSRIFPMVQNAPSESLTNLGRAWITWEIEFGNQKLGIIGIYNRGELQNITTLEFLYDDIIWYGIQDELLVIGRSSNFTNLHWFRTDGTLPTRTLLGSYSNQNVYVSQTQVLFYLFDPEIQESTFIEIFSLGVIPFQSNEKIILTAPGIAIIEQNSGDRIIYTSGNNVTIPSNTSTNIEIGHVGLNPSIIDFENQQIWNPAIGRVSLPKNSNDAYFFGKQSSIIKTTNNSLWELGVFGWEKIAIFEASFQDFAIIDIELYIGTVSDNGLSLITSGLDEDNDGIPSTLEDYKGSLSTTNDTDGDGISDGLEIAWGTNPTLDDADDDDDRDRLSNRDEFLLGTDPKYGDTDFGGALDGWEVKYNFDPHEPSDDSEDPDQDGVPNSLESLWNTSPYSTDTDEDGLPDFWEIQFRLDPVNPNNALEDPDLDGKSNLQEFQDGTDPFLKDRQALFEDLWLIIVLLSTFMVYPALITHRRIVKKNDY